MDKKYRLFVNGKFITGSNSYDEIYQRGLGIAAYIGNMEWENSKSFPKIVDRWKSKDHLIIITKNE